MPEPIPLTASNATRLLGPLPPVAMPVFHRVVRFRPTGLPTATASRPPFRVNLLAPTPTSTAMGTTTPSTVGYILSWVSQSWLIRGQDPLEPETYSRMPSEQGSLGQFSMVLAVGGRNVGQVSENIYSYSGGQYVEVPGWTALNRNLLDWGGSDVSTVLYVPSDTKLEALFYQRPGYTWTNRPDVIEIEMNGFVCPKSVMDRITKQ